MNTRALEQALYLEALKEDESRLPVEAAVALGAVPGAYAGLQAGRPVQSLANYLSGRNKVQTVEAPMPPIQKSAKYLRKALRPGFRLAGALGGALLGGLGGAAVRESMIEESPKARLLAKIQIGQELDVNDLALLEDIAAEHYDNLAKFSRV